MESVTMVTNTLEATAGSAPARSSPSGTSTPARPAMTILVSMAAAITAPSWPDPRTSVTPTPIRKAMVEAVQQRHPDLAPDRAPVVGAGQLVGGDGAHGDRQRLGAGISADPGDDRHQRRQHGHARDRILELGDHHRRHQRGEEVGGKPAHPRRVGFDQWLVDVALAGAGQEQNILSGLFLDDVDDVVDGDHADQPPARVHHRRRDQRIFLELERHFFLVHVDRDQRLLAHHDLAHP